MRVVIPRASKDEGKTYPVLIWMHGGGEIMSPAPSDVISLVLLAWVFGNVDQLDYLLRDITTRLDIVTVNVDYRYAA